jgi:hypothetical protein
VDEPAGNARDQEGVRDLELDRVVDLLLLAREHRVELLGLGDRPGEAVEDEAKNKTVEARSVGGPGRGGSEEGDEDKPELALLVLVELLLDHVDHDVVRDEASLRASSAIYVP